MKGKLTVCLLAVLTASLIASQIPRAQAGWSALNSGYAVTTDWHGADVPMGTSVTATAGTTDGTVESVEFIWKAPDGTLVWTATVPVVPSGDTWDGKPISIAQDTRVLGAPVGDWGVQAIFHGPGGKIHKGQGDDIVRIRATSFFVVPEVSFGAIAPLVAGLCALALLKRKRL